MMKIEYFGHSCFKIENEEGVSFLTDPYTRVGYELPQGLEADAVLTSHGHFDHNFVQGVKKYSVLIEEAGCFEANGVKICGEESWHDPLQGSLRGKNILFKLQTDGLTVCHFGDLGEPYSDELAKKLVDTDIWLIPVGGTYTIDAKEAKKYIENLRPSLVIPMHYRPKDGALDIDGIEAFLTEMDGYTVEACPCGTFELTKELLKKGETKIIYMERQK